MKSKAVIAKPKANKCNTIAQPESQKILYPGMQTIELKEFRWTTMYKSIVTIPEPKN